MTSYTAKAREELARAQKALEKTPEFRAVKKANRALDKAYAKMARDAGGARRGGPEPFRLEARRACGTRT